MPLAKPRSGETKNDFISRCMGDNVMTREYTDTSQRQAVCQSQWGRSKSMSLSIGDFDGDVRPDECDGFAAISAATVADGARRQAFRKELIRVGEYVKASTGQKFSVDHTLLRHWADTFEKMKANGVAVPIPSTHSGAGDPDKSRGFVTGMFVEGDSLVMTCELIGDDAIQAAARNDVSIHSPPEFTDGKGNEYQQPITHVALTPEPLVPGLGAFVTIAASQRLELSQMKWTELAKLLGLEDVTADTAEQKITAAVKKMKGDLAAAHKKLKVTADRESDDPDPKSDKDKDKDKEPKIKPVVSPMMLGLARDNRRLKLDGLVRSGKIDAHTKERLIEQYVSDAALTLALSHSEGTKDEFDQLMTILADNSPVVVGEQSGPQTITLEDGTSRSADDVLLIDAEQRRAAVFAAK